ncbi:MAG: MarR family transcriptional regulator [Chloroflexi bacterium]|nr:MarR family transcriptional regulator [Chloroflexota bacterium]
MSSWGFVTNHGWVLAYLAANDQVTLRQAALDLKLTERSVARIVADLAEEGYLERTREGRINHYRVPRCGSGRRDAIVIQLHDALEGQKQPV